MGKASDFLNSKLGGESAQKIGIAGFTMLARIRESFSYTSEVPTTFLEDGSSVEDTIILNPITLSIEGSVADVYVERSPLQEITSNIASTAGSISIYLPERTQTQQQFISEINAGAQDAINAVDELIDSGSQIANLLGSSNMEGKTLREKFVDTMESLHFGRQLVDIEMPYRTFNNMRINVNIETDNQNDAIAFSIDANQVRIADESSSDISSLIGNASPALGGQEQKQTDKGTQEGEETDSSLLSTVLGVFG